MSEIQTALAVNEIAKNIQLDKVIRISRGNLLKAGGILSTIRHTSWIRCQGTKMLESPRQRTQRHTSRFDDDPILPLHVHPMKATVR